MPTINQRIRKGRPKAISTKSRTPALQKCPQRRGICIKVYMKSPKKPNSANRCVTTLRLSNGKTVMAYVPGQGPHSIQQHSTVLVRGGRVKDLPGILYKLVNGTMDLKGVANRSTSRSKYGTKKPKTT